MGKIFEILMRVDSESEPAKRDLEELSKSLAEFARANAEATAGIEIEKAKVDLDELKARLEQFGAEDVSAKANVQIARAQEEIAVLEAELAKLGSQNVDVDVDLKRGITERIAALSESIARLNGETSSVGGGGSGFASLAGDAAGALGPLGTLAFTIGPAVVATLFAMVASAGAAALGVGALGIAFGASLIPVIGLGIAAIARFKSESGTAGTAANDLKTSVSGIGSALGKALGPGVDAVFRNLAVGFKGVDDDVGQLEPAFTGLGKSVGSSLRVVLQQLTSPEWMAFFTTLTHAAAADVPLLTGAFLGLLNLLRNITTAALPFLNAGLHDLSGAMKDLGSGKINLGPIMSQLSSWLHLIGAVGSALLGLFKGAAGPGQQFVNFLAKGAQSLADWANSAKGQSEIHSFFAKMVPLAEQLVTLIGHVVVGFLHFASAITPALTTVASLLNALPPDVVAVGAALLGLVAAIGPLKILGALFETLGGAELVGAAAGAEGLAGGLEALAAAAAPVSLLVGAIVGGGILLNKVFGDNTNATKDWADALNGFNDADKRAVDSLHAMHDAQQKSAAAWAQANKLTAEGKGNTDAHTKAVQAGAQADLAAAAARQQNAQATQQAGAHLADLQKQYSDYAKTISQIQSQGGLSPFAKALPQMQQNLGQINAQLQLAQLNFQRLGQGKSPVGPDFLAAINQIKSLGGQKIALQLSMSGQTAVVEDIARVTTQLHNVGATPHQIAVILSGDGSVTDKLTKLRALLGTIKDKNVRAAAQTAGEAAVKALNALIGNVSSKTVTVTAKAIGLGALQALKGAIDAIRSKTVTITTATKQVAAGATGRALFDPSLGQNLAGAVNGAAGALGASIGPGWDSLGSGVPAPAGPGRGGSVTNNNIEVTAPPGESPDVNTFIAQITSKVRSLG